jgi:mono/diheme cytochrome c family protein
MMDRGHERDLRPVPGVAFGLAGALATASIVALAAFTAPRPADALPAYAQQTGLACGRCHVNPAGGGPRTSFGNAFAANGHKVPSAKKKGKTSGGAEAPSTVPVTTTPTFVYNDYVRAGAWSLRHPYYSHFLYRPDDYRN